MAAPAPITNETPAWDVPDPFPKSHARARQTKSGNPLSKSLTYSYDSVGNRRSLDAPDSGRFSYVYDAAEQLSSVLNPFSELTTFSYDIAGRRTVQRYSNGTRASIIYDTANNVTQFHNRTSTGTAITTNDYKYDNVGNRTGMLEASGDRLTWSYDNGDQLKSERRSGASGYANTFTYDGVGNRTLKNAGATRTTFSYDIADQLVYSQAVAGRTSYVYDNAGNQQIERPPTGSRTTTVWDNENRPTLYRLPDTTLVTMSYNGNDRRVTKQSATETVKFVWDPVADAYLAEFNGSNVLQATYSQEPVQFGRALTQRRSTTSSWYHTDSQGSTQALSNSSQVTSDTYLYDAWGNPITSTGTTVNPFRWVGNVGYYFDSDTGLYYIRARTYQPTIARWTSADPLFYMLAKAGALGVLTRDPIDYEGSEWNLYEFVRGNPGARTDPSGLDSILPDESQSTCIQCCCCPVSITISHGMDPSGPLTPKWTDRGWVKYQVKVQFTKINVPPGSKPTPADAVCSLEFWEIPFSTIPASVPPIRGGMIPPNYTDGVWNDAVKLMRASEFFDPWEKFTHPQSKPCETKNGPTSGTVTLTNRPGAKMALGGRFLYFYSMLRINGSSHPMCKCKPPKVQKIFMGHMTSLGWQAPTSDNSGGPGTPPTP